MPQEAPGARVPVMLDAQWVTTLPRRRLRRSRHRLVLGRSMPRDAQCTGVGTEGFDHVRCLEGGDVTALCLHKDGPLGSRDALLHHEN